MIYIFFLTDAQKFKGPAWKNSLPETQLLPFKGRRLKEGLPINSVSVLTYFTYLFYPLLPSGVESLISYVSESIPYLFIVVTIIVTIYVLLA